MQETSLQGATFLQQNSAQADLIHVFVYGTLKPGEANFLPYCQGKVRALRAALVQGEIFDFPQFGYPAMTPGKLWVQGYILSFDDDAILAELDGLEDYDPQQPDEQNIYRREWIEVFDGDRHSCGHAWCYRMIPQLVREFGGLPVPSGNWRGNGQAVAVSHSFA